MNGLERELTELAAAIEWPEAPDVASRVSERLREPSTSGVRGRALVLVLALAVAATLAAFAVPSARSAILEWLGIGGARISIVDELPPVRTVPGLEILGDRVTLAVARARAGFPFRDPPAGEPRPDQVRVAPGGRVSYVWLEGKRARLLVTQFPGSVDDPGIVKKLAGSGTRVEEFRIGADLAVWLVGGPHAVLFVAPDGSVREETGWLAGNTLLVDRNGVTLRIEGALDREDAVSLARSLGP